MVKVNDQYNYKEILKPFFSKRQVEKGEAEAIALAYIWYKTNRCHKLILDDGQARAFVEANIGLLRAIMIGTVGFIGDCHCFYSIFGKDEALKLLYAIKNSTFRIKDKDLSNVKQRIEGC
jgi:predicted nucleic acid-binding protein